MIDGFRTSGALRVLFPRREPGLEGVLVNTSGGLTGGDRLCVAGTVGEGAALTLTTQAAERAYRARTGVARVATRIEVAAGAHMAWLPQELILYDGAALDRSLEIDLAPDATLLLAEPVIFGRTAMGEVLRTGQFRDRIAVRRNGAPLYLDGVSLSGGIAARLARPGVAGGARAMASVLYVAPDAEARIGVLRPRLPHDAGASLLAPDTLAMRFVCNDGYDLRTALLPVLDRLSRNTLPASWRL